MRHFREKALPRSSAGFGDRTPRLAKHCRAAVEA
jgi:hypothetical protein